MSTTDRPTTLSSEAPRARGGLRSGPGRATGETLVVASLFGLQGGGALATRLFAQVPVPGVVTLRLGIAALILLATHRPKLGLLRSRWPIVLPAGLVLYVHHLGFYQAIDRVPLGTATTIEFLGPFLLTMWFSETWRHRLWGCLALAGVVVLCRPAVVTDWVGIASAVAAGAAWASYILFARRLGDQAPGQTLALTISVGAAASLVAGGTALLPHLDDPTVLGVGLGVAVLSSVLPYTLQLHALRNLPPRAFSVLLSLEPAVAAAVGLAFLHQQLGSLQWGGIVTVVLASIGATWRQRPQARMQTSSTHRVEPDPRERAADAQTSTARLRRRAPAVPRSGGRGRRR